MNAIGVDYFFKPRKKSGAVFFDFQNGQIHTRSV